MTYEEAMSFPYCVRMPAAGTAGAASCTASAAQPAHLPTFTPKSIRTTDEIPIRKYPPTGAMPKVSDIGLYQYNFRDLNSVLTSGNVRPVSDDNTLPVAWQDIHKYAYINATKICWPCEDPRTFLFGNFSPPIGALSDMDVQWFQGVCTAHLLMGGLGGTAAASSRYPLLHASGQSVVAGRPYGSTGTTFLEHCRAKAGSAQAGALQPWQTAPVSHMPSVNLLPNVYQAFCDFWEAGGVASEQHTASLKEVRAWFTEYFTLVMDASVRA